MLDPETIRKIKEHVVAAEDPLSERRPFIIPIYGTDEGVAGGREVTFTLYATWCRDEKPEGFAAVPAELFDELSHTYTDPFNEFPADMVGSLVRILLACGIKHIRFPNHIPLPSKTKH